MAGPRRSLPHASATVESISRAMNIGVQKLLQYQDFRGRI